MLDRVFTQAVLAAEERIRKMEHRYVEEADQNSQPLLEIRRITTSIPIKAPSYELGLKEQPRAQLRPGRDTLRNKGLSAERHLGGGALSSVPLRVS